MQELEKALIRKVLVKCVLLIRAGHVKDPLEPQTHGGMAKPLI